MKFRRAFGALVLAGLTAVPAFAATGVASAQPTPSVTAPADSDQIQGVPAEALPSRAEQIKIQTTIKNTAPSLVEGQTVLVDTYQGVPVYVQKRSGLVQVQIGSSERQGTGALQPRFSFCENVVAPAALAAIAVAGGAAAVLTGGIVLPEYGIVITGAQLAAASQGVGLATALYNLVKAQVCS